MHELKSSSHFVIKKFSNTFLCKEEDTERVKMRWALLFAVVQKQKGKRALSFYELLPFWLVAMNFRLFSKERHLKCMNFLTLFLTNSWQWRILKKREPPKEFLPFFLVLSFFQTICCKVSEISANNDLPFPSMYAQQSLILIAKYHLM